MPTAHAVGPRRVSANIKQPKVQYQTGPIFPVGFSLGLHGHGDRQGQGQILDLVQHVQ